MFPATRILVLLTSVVFKITEIFPPWGGNRGNIHYAADGGNMFYSWFGCYVYVIVVV